MLWASTLAMQKKTRASTQDDGSLGSRGSTCEVCHLRSQPMACSLARSTLLAKGVPSARPRPESLPRRRLTDPDPRNRIGVLLHLLGCTFRQHWPASDGRAWLTFPRAYLDLHVLHTRSDTQKFSLHILHCVMHRGLQTVAAVTTLGSHFRASIGRFYWKAQPRSSLASCSVCR